VDPRQHRGCPLAGDTPVVVVADVRRRVPRARGPGFAAGAAAGTSSTHSRPAPSRGTITFALFLLFGILRVNLFLDVIRNRSDWENLVADYARSDFRACAGANYVYAKGLSSSPWWCRRGSDQRIARRPARQRRPPVI
jgi:hypothetical protein